LGARERTGSRTTLPSGAPDERQSEENRHGTAQDVDRGALRDQLAAGGGLTGTERVDVEMISPLMEVTGGERGVNDLLAGDFIGTFGGFLDRRIRASDFALGWRSVASWAPGARPAAV
jgi:hypothetical protein